MTGVVTWVTTNLASVNDKSYPIKRNQEQILSRTREIVGDMRCGNFVNPKIQIGARIQMQSSIFITSFCHSIVPFTTS